MEVDNLNGRVLYTKKLSAVDAFRCKAIKIPRLEALERYVGKLKNKQSTALTVVDEQGQHWDLVCTCHNAVYSLSRIGKFCATLNLHPGDYLVFYKDCKNMLRVAKRKSLPAHLHTGPAPNTPLMHSHRKRPGQGSPTKLPPAASEPASSPSGAGSSSGLSARTSAPIPAGPQLPLRWRRLQSLEQQVVSSYGRVSELLTGCRDLQVSLEEAQPQGTSPRPRGKHHLSRCTTPRDLEACVEQASVPAAAHSTADPFSEVTPIEVVPQPAPPCAEPAEQQAAAVVAAPVALGACTQGSPAGIPSQAATPDTPSPCARAHAAALIARPSLPQPPAALIRSLMAGGCSAFRANNLARLHMARGSSPDPNAILKGMEGQQQPNRRW